MFANMYKRIIGLILYQLVVLLPMISQNAITNDFENKIKEVSIWTGNISESWDNAGNWDLNQVPGANDNVTIPVQPIGDKFPLIEANMEGVCNELSIESGSILKIRGFLTVSETLTCTDVNSLVILSDESGTGSLIFNSENVSGSVQRYLTDGTNHFIGASTTGATVNDLYFNGDPAVFMYNYSEDIGEWSAITDLNTPLESGIGYSVFVSDAENKQNVTATFIGELIADDLVVPPSALSYSEESPYPGYNLISNPFTSCMSWDLSNWQSENLSGSIWLWNGLYNYLFRNAQGMGNLANGIVPTSQAFFVRAIASNATLTLSADDRVHSNQNFYKKSNRDNEAYIALEVRKQDKTDEVWVAFCDECAEDEDIGWDTEKLYGSADAPQLFIKTSDNEMSIDALPLLGAETKTLELHFIAGESGEHSIAYTDFNNGGMEGIAVLLKDLFENTEQFLSMNPTYYFNADVNDAENRFEIDIWEMPLAIPDISKDQYSIYSLENSIRIRPLKSSSKENLIVQIFDLSGRMIIEVESTSENEITIPFHGYQTYVVVRLISDNSVFNKKLYVK